MSLIKRLTSLAFGYKSKQHVYLVIYFNNHECRVEKIYTNRVSAEKARARMSKYVNGPTTFHVIEKAVEGTVIGFFGESVHILDEGV